jgi:hypothetical protein
MVKGYPLRTRTFLIAVFFIIQMPQAMGEGWLSNQCQPVSVGDFISRYSSKSPLTIKFFASWCGSCKDDLEILRGQALRDDLILLSAFDDKKSAVETLRYFDVRQRCLGGDALARKLGVRHLPRTFRFERGKFEEILPAESAVGDSPRINVSKSVVPTDKGKM